MSEGRVLVAGTLATKSSRLVSPGEALALTGMPPRFVSRGGEKLAAALDRFGVDVTGRRALDAGASTGGFTDCLLQRGAVSVLAVDVGRGQLHERLRNDPRVRQLDRTNIRDLTLAGATAPGAAPDPFEVITADLSFISLRTVAHSLVDELAGPGADVVVLIKPQFEAGRMAASAGRGVIRDPEVWSEVLATVTTALCQHKATIMGVMVSPITGADGNVEFLGHVRAHTPASAGPAAEIEAAVEAARTLVGDRA